VPVDVTRTGVILLAVGAALRAGAGRRGQGFRVSRWARKP